MKTCAVQSCKNNSNERPDLCFFKIPREKYTREEWFEVLGVSKDIFNNATVCEIHFKERDFRSGKKKELKIHAVPVLNLGQSEAVDSDEEYLPYDPDNDPEIIEFQAEMKSKSQHTEKKSLTKEKAEQLTSPDLVQETGRRPSRRAALVAAKKISNTVRNLGVDDNKPIERPANLSPSQKPINTYHPYTKQKSKKAPAVNVDLQMECCDDFLSPVQAECLLKSQIQYNMVMKNLRELMACNVKVTQTDANGVPIVATSVPSTNLKNGNVDVNSTSVKSKPVNTGPALVVPMTLIQSPILIT